MMRVCVEGAAPALSLNTLPGFQAAGLLGSNRLVASQLEPQPSP